jgi:hypothetical protein
MNDDDAPGYLMDALRTALGSGLTHLTLFRVGSTKIMWQASCRARGDHAYRVAIEADPVAALCAVMSGTIAPTTPAPLVEDIFA